jgi:putative MATE family efflux protein
MSDSSASGAHALLAQRPLRAIVALAAPTTAVMLIAALSNVLHTYFVSRLGDQAIAAVALVFPISLIMLTVVGGGLGAGIASGIARAMGAGRAADARSLAEHGLAISALLALASTLATELGGAALFRAMGGTGAVLGQATLFARVLFAALLLTFTIGTCDSILRGTGNVRVPALCATLSLGLQIAFTPLFMFGFGLGLVGAPLATTAGQLIGFGPRALYIFGGRGTIRPRPWPRHLNAGHVREILRVGVPAALSAALNYIALVVLTGVVARFGDTHLAAYGLGTRLDFLLFSVAFGVGAAAMTLVGMATGAGRSDLVARYVHNAVITAIAVIAVPVCLVIWRPELWLGLFSEAPDILQVGSRYFRWVAPSYLFVAASMVFAAAFQALGRATVPLTVMVARVVVVVTAALVAVRWFGWGAEVVFALIAAGNVGTCLLLAALFRFARRN